MASRDRVRLDVAHLVAGLAAIAAVTLVYARVLHESNTATVSTTFLLVVLLVAATSRLAVAVVTSIAAMLALNFFFLPPSGTLTIADPQNWVALFAFLTVSLVASHLSAVAHTRTDEAVARRDELARLFDLSRDVLVVADGPDALDVLARAVGRRFDLTSVAIALPRDDEWEIHGAGARPLSLDARQLDVAFAAAGARLEFDAHARTYAGHTTMVVGDTTVRIVPLRASSKPIGVLAAVGRPIEAGTLDALAGVVSLAIERVRLLEERTAAERTREREELKTALLASLGHDLRTPLTTIRVAANNIKDASIAPDEREEQSDLILAEAERLSRLFQDILDMARIDAGAVAAAPRWAYPSEIVAAARDQVEQALHHHTVDVHVEADRPVRLDPRLVAAALAHVLENAAQYAPPDSTIDVRSHLSDEGLVIGVHDHGPGLTPADLPRVFERFYRGPDAVRTRASGTGLGLWIARGLLAAAQGRIWAENDPNGGAVFTIVVPAEIRAQDEEPG
jgi:two-component system sensor histidine kinase KdpD